jgi:hypothetical protein
MAIKLPHWKQVAVRQAFGAQRRPQIVDEERSTHRMRTKSVTLILILLGTLGLMGCGQGAIYRGSSSWAIVNNSSNAGPTASLTIPATGTGNLIVVALMFNGGTSVDTISDNAGNTYVSAGAEAALTDRSTEIWYAVNSKPGATVITPTLVDSSTFIQMTVWEVSGISFSGPDVTNTSSGNLTLNNIPGPAVTTTQADDFIVSILFAMDTNIISISSGSKFTNDFTTWGNGWAHITSNFAPVGTYQASWFTSTPQGIYCASTVAFRAAH